MTKKAKVLSLSIQAYVVPLLFQKRSMGSTNKPTVFTVVVKVQMKKLINNLVTALEECDNFR